MTEYSHDDRAVLGHDAHPVIDRTATSRVCLRACRDGARRMHAVDRRDHGASPNGHPVISMSTVTPPPATPITTVTVTAPPPVTVTVAAK
ncbi:MAG: hypothetical protein QOK12_1415 [Mycobacterium sp.]|nr:hypothetical protein [Mycobacterium sp.]